MTAIAIGYTVRTLGEDDDSGPDGVVELVNEDGTIWVRLRDRRLVCMERDDEGVWRLVRREP